MCRYVSYYVLFCCSGLRIYIHERNSINMSLRASQTNSKQRLRDGDGLSWYLKEEEKIGGVVL